MLLYLIVFIFSTNLNIVQPLKHVDFKTEGIEDIKKQINLEVQRSTENFLESSIATDEVTKDYTLINLRQNVLNALKTIKAGEKDSLIFVKQDTGTVEADNSNFEQASSIIESEPSNSASNVEDKEEFAEPEVSTTPLNGLSTAVKINQNVFQFIGEAIKTIFKGIGRAKKWKGSRNTVFESEELVNQIPKIVKEPYNLQLIRIINFLNKENKDEKLEKEPCLLNKEKAGCTSNFLNENLENQDGMSSILTNSTLESIKFLNLTNNVVKLMKKNIQKF